MSKYDVNFGNLKITFKGKFSAQKILEELTTVLIPLQEEFEIEEFSGVNFYFNIYKDEVPQRLVLKEKSSKSLSTVTIESKSSHKTITKQEDGSKLYKFEKDFDFEKFKNNVENKIQQDSFLKKEKFSLMTKEELDREIEKENEKIRALKEEQKKRNEEEQKIIRKQQEIKEKIINDFRDKIKIDFNIKEEDFNKKVSSLAKIVSETVIKKYLGDVEGLDKEYFRVTMKNEETGRAGDIYIYDMDHKMIKKIERK